jgi:hypothetical protein
LNQGARRIHVLQEAWIIQALVREDGLSQLEVAELLGRHKTWVCRRLALLEKLALQVRQDLQLGLLSVTAARELLRFRTATNWSCWSACDVNPSRRARFGKWSICC